jgi:hypothetical protein
MNKKKYILNVCGIIIGLIGYRVFFWGTKQEPQVFFNVAILTLLCFVLSKIDKIQYASEKRNSEKDSLRTLFVIMYNI